jgi:hypothetical protein
MGPVGRCPIGITADSLARRIRRSAAFPTKRDPPDVRAAKADLAAILERRPDLKGKSLEAAKPIMRREAGLSL